MVTFNRVKSRIQRYGITKTVQYLGLKTVNRVVLLNILKGVKIEKVNPDFLRCSERYRCLFLDHPMLREFSMNSECDLSSQFLETAFDKGDECYAILDGARLAAYGWYSRQPTAIMVPGLQLRFDQRYIYMYKGFTQADYRGQRLHAVAMTHALAAYLERGYKGIISYVDWNNFESLSSCYRMGYEDFGKGYILGFRGRYLLHSSSGWKRHAFGLERAGERSKQTRSYKFSDLKSLR